MVNLQVCTRTPISKHTNWLVSSFLNVFEQAKAFANIHRDIDFPAIQKNVTGLELKEMPVFKNKSIHVDAHDSDRLSLLYVILPL